MLLPNTNCLWSLGDMITMFWPTWSSSVPSSYPALSLFQSSAPISLSLSLQDHDYLTSRKRGTSKRQTRDFRDLSLIKLLNISITLSPFLSVDTTQFHKSLLDGTEAYWLSLPVAPQGRLVSSLAQPTLTALGSGGPLHSEKRITKGFFAKGYVFIMNRFHPKNPFWKTRVFCNGFPYRDMPKNAIWFYLAPFFLWVCKWEIHWTWGRCPLWWGGGWLLSGW